MDRRSLRFLAYRYFNQKLLGSPNGETARASDHGISHHFRRQPFKGGYVWICDRSLEGVVEQFTHKVLLNVLTI